MDDFEVRQGLVQMEPDPTSAPERSTEPGRRPPITARVVRGLRLVAFVAHSELIAGMYGKEYGWTADETRLVRRAIKYIDALCDWFEGVGRG